MTAWYYSDTQRNRLGPVAASDLELLHSNGQLAPEILVWREGMPDWKPWREVMAEVLGGPVATPARASFAIARDDTPGGGNPYEVVERVQPASPYSAPSAALGHGYASAVTDGEVVYAGFWKRVAAYFIDFAVVVGASMIIGGVIGAFLGITGNAGNPLMMSGIQIVTSLAGIAYFAAFHASSLQATPGKLAVGIKVTRPNGESISFLRGIGRYFATILSSLILMIGFVMAGFTERKQALHDMVCDTLVVDRWAFTSRPERQNPALGAVTIVVLVLGVVATAGMVLMIGWLAMMVGTGAR